MAYLILDEETQTHTRFKRKANPFLPENYIVARGWKVEGDERCTAEFYDSVEDVKGLHIPARVDTIVAHNAKFELLYEMRFSSESLRQFFKRGGKVWCTQYAEYLINAQQQKFHMAPLDMVAPLYGGRVKIDGIKALWDAGVQTSDIDRDLLTDYLIGTEDEGRNSGDIGNTELVYLGQRKACEELGMLTAVERRMDGLCCTAEMEFNGLKVDTKRARADLAERTVELEEAEAELAQYLTDLPEGLAFNWNSPVHKSALLYGGTIKYPKREPYIDEKTGKWARKLEEESWPLIDGHVYRPGEDAELREDGLWYAVKGRIGQQQDTFKGGKRKGEPKFKKVKVYGELKVKWQDFFHELPGYCTPDDDWKSALTDGAGGPVYSTSSDIIDRVSKRHSDIGFLRALGRRSLIEKDISNFYVARGKDGLVGMLTCVQPWDHFIHHKLNHTSTVTSRLSSSDPNMQIMARADDNDLLGRVKSTAKAMFVSRFGEDGEMMEADYSQLEVVGQGLLTRDDSLIADLKAKIDFHCKRVSLKNSVSYQDSVLWCKDENHPEYQKWKKERTKCKIFSFQRAYGAGAALIADETGMDIDEVKAMMEAEDKAYPGVVAFNKSVEKEVNATAEPFRDPERGFRTFRRGTWQAITGTLYSWRSYDAPAFLRRKGVADTFKPTELKNYPVQGTSGELVQMALGVLWRWFVKNDNFGGLALLVNTVHDCVWVDLHCKVCDIVCTGVKRIMEGIPLLLKSWFNIDCPVEFPVDVETGPNMLELHHWTPETT